MYTLLQAVTQRTAYVYSLYRYDGDKKKHKTGHPHHTAAMSLGGGLLSPTRPGTGTAAIGTTGKLLFIWV